MFADQINNEEDTTPTSTASLTDSTATSTDSTATSTDSITTSTDSIASSTESTASSTESIPSTSMVTATVKNSSFDQSILIGALLPTVSVVILVMLAVSIIVATLWKAKKEKKEMELQDSYDGLT